MIDKSTFKKILVLASNLVYPLAGFFGDWLTFICGILLGIGSAWMHYEEEFKGRRSLGSIYTDWITMYAFFLSLLAYHTNIYVIFILVTIIMMWEEMREQKLIGMLVLLTIMVTQAYWAFIPMIPAVIIRNEWEYTRHQEYSHSAWHLLTGAGAYLIIQYGV